MTTTKRILFCVLAPVAVVVLGKATGMLAVWLPRPWSTFFIPTLVFFGLGTYLLVKTKKLKELEEKPRIYNFLRELEKDLTPDEIRKINEVTNRRLLEIEAERVKQLALNANAASTIAAMTKMTNSKPPNGAA